MWEQCGSSVGPVGAVWEPGNTRLKGHSGHTADTSVQQTTGPTPNSLVASVPKRGEWRICLFSQTVGERVQSGSSGPAPCGERSRTRARKDSRRTPWERVTGRKRPTKDEVLFRKSSQVKSSQVKSSQVKVLFRTARSPVRPTQEDILFRPDEQTFRLPTAQRRERFQTMRLLSRSAATPFKCAIPSTATMVPSGLAPKAALRMLRART